MIQGLGARLRAPRGLALLGGVAVLVVIAVLVAIWWIQPRASAESDPVAVTVPVAISGVQIPGETRIGVVVTLGAAAEGSQWSGAAQGAVVARERLARGGSAIEVLVEDDLGTDAGAENAVRALQEQGVSGIVYASSGAHVSAGVAVAELAQIPVVLPYAPAPKAVSGVWSLVPGDDTTATLLVNALAGYLTPLHVSAGGRLPSGVDIGDEVRFEVGSDVDQFAALVAERAGIDPHSGGAYSGGQDDDGALEQPTDPPADVIVVSGPPALQASIVRSLQSHDVWIPLVLTPEAMCPVFGATLIAEGGTVSPNLRTVGASWGDAGALESSARGRAMSAYLAAIRDFSGDERVTSLMGDAPFADVAAVADVRSHDALLALVEAAAEAGSREPALVLEALARGEGIAGRGMAGPELDFSRPQALAGEVTELFATSQHLGLRPAGDSAQERLVWVPEPGSP